MIFWVCSCGQLFIKKKHFVRHRMSARKATRSIKHAFQGKYIYIKKSEEVNKE